MKRKARTLFLGAILLIFQAIFEAPHTQGALPLVESSCMDCHDEATKTRLDFTQLGNDYSDPETFGMWLAIYDQAKSGAMPPKKKKRPDPAKLEHALDEIGGVLLHANLQQQKENGRVPLRRLTRLEYEYTLHDLLSIQSLLRELLPAENNGGFDTLSKHQELSPIHIRQYLDAADLALDAAFQNESPKLSTRVVDYAKSPYMEVWFDLPWSDGGAKLKRLDDAIVSFVRTDFIWRTDRNGFIAKAPGMYRVTADVYTHQARSPVTLLLSKAHGNPSVPTLLGAFDLQPGESRQVVLTASLEKDAYILPSFSSLLKQPDGRELYGIDPSVYKGEGIAVRSIKVEGPLRLESPPRFQGVATASSSLAKKDYPVRIRQTLSHFAPRAFRRPVSSDELDFFASLAQPALDADLSFATALRLPLQAILTSPQFLHLPSKPGKLDDDALASRLSYFLWKSLPDEELLELAKKRQLSEPATLRAQVDRMLNNPKSMRFVRDFLGQWLGLDDIDATTPDKVLYPEYDDHLRHSMLTETELFFHELIQENLGAGHLIDSDFTFLNRKLAEHYGIAGVKDQTFQKTRIPPNSPRGGILTHASVLKVTANGTTTSPVRRGNFVLAHLLGKPSPPPPANAGSIEPDIRGARTIKQILAAHRNSESCARCHRHIDPPGFALESFDVIGGFRSRYRKLLVRPNGEPANRFAEGLAVDPSGQIYEGAAFSGFSDFRQFLLAAEEKHPDLSRHLIRQLVAYATGADIQFADRPKIDDIVARTKRQNFGLRSILHEIIQSPLFTYK